jgi:hypothetical protein
MGTTFFPVTPYPGYLVEIRSTNNLIVEAWLPETFGFGAESSFAPFMTNGQFLKGKMGELANDASQMMAQGLVLQSQAATAQLYQGSGYISFSLPLELVADSNTNAQVIQPVKNLLAMVAPSKGAKGLLKAPVTYNSSFEPDNYVSLTIGKFFHARQLLCKSVSPVFESLIEKGSGNPMKVKVDVTLETMKVPTIEDILNWFIT